jgi:hypothetical protein
MPFGPLLGCAIMLLFMGMTARGAYESLHRSRWQRIDGTVLRAYVSETTSGSTVTFSGAVDYRYTYMGMPYTGTLSTCMTTRLRSQADASIAPYTQGQRLDVHVYTWRPAHSTLKAGFDPSYAGIFCMSLLFFCAFAAIAFTAA